MANNLESPHSSSESNRSKGLEGHLVDLEMKLAYQEQTITSLNEVIVDQGKEIEGLKASLKMLHRQVTQWMEDHSNASGSGVPHEKPPHY